jgi:hypothetical protein
MEADSRPANCSEVGQVSAPLRQARHSSTTLRDNIEKAHPVGKRRCRFVSSQDVEHSILNLHVEKGEKNA